MKILGKILGGFYTVIFGIVLLVFLAMMYLGQLFVPEYYTNLIKDLDFSSYKVKELDLFTESELKDYDDDTTLEDYVVLKMVDSGFGEGEAKELLNDKKVRELFGNILGNYMVGLTKNEKVPDLTIEEVKVAFKNYSVDESFYEDFVNTVNEHYAQNAVETDDEEVISKAINFISGSKIIMIFLGFLVFSYLLMILMTWSFIKPLKYLGIPVIGVGVISIGFKFALKAISAAFASDFKGFLPLVTNNGSSFLTFGLLLIIMGISLEILYMVLKTNLILKKTIKTIDEREEVETEAEEETESEEKQV